MKQKPRPILTIQVGRGITNMERASSISVLLVQVLQKNFRNRHLAEWRFLRFTVIVMCRLLVRYWIVAFLDGLASYPNTTSSTIITLNPNAKDTVPMLECFPADISGISSSTTT